MCCCFRPRRCMASARRCVCRLVLPAGVSSGWRSRWRRPRLGATLTLVLARVRFGEPILGVSRLFAVLLFVPIGILGVPAFGFGRGRGSLFLSQGNLDAVAHVVAQLRSPASVGADDLGGPPAARRRGGRTVAGLARGWPGLVVFAGAQLAFDGLFAAGWERVRFSGPRRAQRALASWPSTDRGCAGGPIVGLLQKDWRTLVRDPRWRTGALVSLVALGLPAMALFAGDPFARTGAHAPLLAGHAAGALPGLPVRHPARRGDAGLSRAATSRCCGRAGGHGAHPAGQGRWAAWCWSWA